MESTLYWSVYIYPGTRYLIPILHSYTVILQNEVQNVQMQLGVAGSELHVHEMPHYIRVSCLFLSTAMDTHHLFKCKGTFVGHAVCSSLYDYMYHI